MGGRFSFTAPPSIRSVVVWSALSSSASRDFACRHSSERGGNDHSQTDSQVYLWAPSTRLWIENNGSLEDRDFAFRWLHGFHPYDSFPSGHMAIACTLASLTWFFLPKWRWLSAASAAIIAVCLIITNYHFVGDIIAGGFIGWLGGAWSVQCMPRSILPTDIQMKRPQAVIPLSSCASRRTRSKR